MLRCTDHLPLIPDIGNYLFGGSSSDQAITLGGTNADGSDAVCDMTYVMLKATEVLGLRDPNVNARYDPDVSSDAYLRRLCEVNRDHVGDAVSAQRPLGGRLARGHGLTRSPTRGTGRPRAASSRRSPAATWATRAR